MKRWHLVLVAAALGMLLSSNALAGRAEFILDVSGSMKAKVGTETKIDAARKALAAAIAETPEGSIAALRLYGHRVPNEKKAESCVDSQLIIPFGPINKPQFLAALQSAQPLGQTPIAYSLQQAAADFGQLGDEVAQIILVSDGEETCGGDPVAAVRELIARGFKLRVDTVGFDVDPKARAQLEGVAKATGGVYRDARDAAGLAATLKELSQQSFLIKKEKAEYGEPIKGGDTYETAVPLEPGKLYSLSHHQRKNQYDYFVVSLAPGQELKGTFQTSDTGVEIAGEKATETQYPYSGLEIHDASHQKVAGETIIGGRNATKQVSHVVRGGQGGNYYVLIGNTYNDMHKNSPFKIELVDHFDAGTKQDAPEGDREALPLAPGAYSGFLTRGDLVDAYRFTAAPGQAYEIKARPASDQVRFKLTVVDSDGVMLASQAAPNEGSAVRIEALTLPRGGEFVVKVASAYSDIPPTDYTFSVTPAGTAAEVPAGSAPAAEATGATLPAQTAAGAAAAAPAPALPAVPASATGAATAGQISGMIRALPVAEGAKFYLLYSVAPLGAGFLIGAVWGFLKGRRRRAG